MHLDEERMQRFLDGELEDQEAREAREHLATCADCGRRVAETRREIVEVDFLLRGLDHAVLPVHAETVIEQAGTVRSRARDPQLLRVAAGFAIAVVLAGAAYAIPGSPVPRWVNAVVEWIAEHPAPSVPVPAVPDTGFAGIAIVPGDNFVIEFVATQSMGGVRVLLTDDRELTVRAPIGASSFGSDEDRLVVDNRGATAVFEVRIPRGAPRVEVRLDGRAIFLKEGQGIISEGSVDASGSHVVPLGSSGR